MDSKHLTLLCDIGELGALLAGSSDVETFLQKIVSMVATHLQTDVCSIYLYDESASELVLKATHGLNQSSIGHVRLKLGDGLVGQSLKELRPILEGKASENPNFKYFEETGEERFNSFLATPILRGIEKIGVLVIQKEQPESFTEFDAIALRATAAQLAGAIENARVLIDLNTDRTPQSKTTSDRPHLLIRGQSASEGSALAPITVLDHAYPSLSPSQQSLPVAGTIDDLNSALDATATQLQELQDRLERRLPEVASLIFTAHMMMLKDTKFVGDMRERVRQGETPDSAVRGVATRYVDRFRASKHAYMREKAVDVEDLSQRILANLMPYTRERIVFHEGRIVIARELFPSDILKLTTENVAGIILVSGGVTTHVAILARSLRIPLVIADNSELLSLPKGTLSLLDADVGNIYVNPKPEVIRQFLARDEARKSAEPMKSGMLDTTETLDGDNIQLLANINLLSELGLARELKAEGIGLYRTEFPFLIRQTFPTEDEQYNVYKTLFDQMPGKCITIRTLDVGGEKVLAYYDEAREANPELGLRSIRFSMRHRDVFEQQIRAILRAAHGHDTLRIMFPMISGLDEFREARDFVLSCIEDLDREGIDHGEVPEIGMMVEMPSVVQIIDELAAEADFFSIGTNDFVMYMLAVDRANEKVAKYYRPDHPSVLRALSKIVFAARKAGKRVSVCGEMAHETRYLPFLIGIGVRELSVDPHYLPVLQQTLLGLSTKDAEAHARKLLEESSLDMIDTILSSSVPNPTDSDFTA